MPKDDPWEKLPMRRGDVVKVKHKTGRPRRYIDWELFEDLCKIQCTQQEIADFLRCSVDTLERAVKMEYKIPFAEIFAQKRGTGKISLRRKQYQMVEEEGNATLAIWLGKQYLGQAEPHQRIALEASKSARGESNDLPVVQVILPANGFEDPGQEMTVEKEVESVVESVKLSSED